MKYKKVVVHSQSGGFCMIITAISKLLFCKTVHTFRSFDINPPPNLLTTRIDVLTSTCKNINSFFKSTPSYLKRIKFISNGVNLKDFNNKNNKKKLRKNKKISKESFVLLFLSQLHDTPKSYGLELIFKSIGLLKAAKENVLFIIVGEGAYKTKLLSLIKKYSISENVIFFPFTKSPVDYYNLADLYLQSPFSPYQSIASLEAMGSGLPVINCVTKGGEALINNYNGLICKKNSNEIAKKVRFLKNNPKIRETYSINAIKRIQDHYTWSKITQEYIKVYNTLLNKEN
jgi:L-malate glycosyltransferase